jgi:5-methylcytosine-specific restriction endonuclease McrA
VERALLLNATYEPLKVIDWQRAVTLLWQGKVEVLEVYDREIRSVTWNTKLPAVLRLVYFVKVEYTKRAINFSRANIFLRDNYSCQYCGRHFRTEELTFDHVVPIAKGGRKVWENIVTACWRCNNKKSGRTPMEAGMHLIKWPTRPDWKPFFTFTIGLRNVPAVWRDYLYWNVELDHDQQ